MANAYSDEYLMHHGVKGQRWGIRRYQNKDGSLKKKEKRNRNEDRSLKKKEKRNRRYLIGGLLATGSAFAVANRYLFKLPIKEAPAKLISKGFDFVKKSVGGAL